MSTRPAAEAVATATEGQGVAIEAVLRCLARETHERLPCSGGTWRLPLPTSGLVLDIPVLHRSPTGWHRFGPPRLANASDACTPAESAGRAEQVDLAMLVTLVARESRVRVGAAHTQVGDVVARVLDSARRVDQFVAAVARTGPSPATGSPVAPGFLDGEQALLHGHPFHPAAKSRDGLHEAEEAASFPELFGTLRLHWYAVRSDLLAHGSATPVPPARTVAGLAGDLAVPDGFVAVPVHPWQARDLHRRPHVQAMVSDGALHDLGPAGPAWWPTSSLRTVWNPQAECQLKLSLGLRITNSRRDNLRHELDLGVRSCRLLDEGLGDALHAHHPRFTVVRDHGWLDVESPGHGPDGDTPTGFAVGLRDNPFADDSPSVCMAGLVSPGPAEQPSRLGRLLEQQAHRSGEPTARVARAWLHRYLDEVVAPVLWLRFEHGIALEAHQQNTLVDLDAHGWPVGGRYRDSQGWYAAESHHPALDTLVPGFADDVHAVFEDALVDERLTYYLVVNNVLGLVGALGSQGISDEALLLRDVREWLTALAGAHARTPPLLDRLLDAPSLPCKANLLTSVDGRDELTETVQQQSVYVDIANPIAQGPT
jgi:siderophore synthetase component